MHKGGLVAGLLLLSAASSVFATPFVRRADLVELQGRPAVAPSLAPRVAIDAMGALDRLVEFERKMQSSPGCTMTSDTCSFGGQIEVEIGDGAAIVQSDNTQEAIWDWSFYHRRGGTNAYQTQINNAFQYLNVFPGPKEWHDDPAAPGPSSYYSIYNCGWGVRAVLEYELVHPGDVSHRAYGDACAAHLAQYANIASGASLIDVGTSAWAASGLWLWADARADATLRARAADLGAAAKRWLEADPSRPSLRTWAISGGAVFAGVVGSYFKQHPDELAAWVTQVQPQLGGWVDETMALPTPRPADAWKDWRNAHAAWNMLAQFEAAASLGAGKGDPARAVAEDVLARLLAQDTDADGGIPGSQQRPASEDQSWITSYVAYFGLRPYLASATSTDPEPPPPAMNSLTPMGGEGCSVTGRPSASSRGAWLWDPLESTCRHASLSIL